MADQDRWDRVKEIWNIIDRLRGDSGCPWDRKQTPQSVQTYLIEEAHEAAAAVRNHDIKESAEELGDLLFMVFFMIHLYEEQGAFSLTDVSKTICEKMIRRHPHVFGDASVNSAGEVRDNWEKIKARENAAKNKKSSEVPASLPALVRAYRLLSRRSKSDATLNNVAEQKEKLLKTCERIALALERNTVIAEEDLGDALLVLVNLGRLQGYRAEDCLHKQINGEQMRTTAGGREKRV